MSEFILKEKLEELLLKNWTYFIDKTRFLRRVLEDVQKADLSQSHQSELPAKQVKLSVTKMEPEKSGFVLWAEFSIPVENGVAVGTLVYHLRLSGGLDLKESYGHIFVTETS